MKHFFRYSAFAIIFSWCMGLDCLAQVAVNTDESPPDNSAMLDVKSTTRGMLVPRMSATERDNIAGPAKGLLIYCTNNDAFYYNSGTSSSPFWQIIGSQWITTGTDIYYPGGSVGVGMPPNASAILDLKSTSKGLLIPRLTISLRDGISQPATGLLVFCTDENSYFYNAGSPAAPYWQLLGSYWKSTTTKTYYENGNVGIGTSTPEFKLSLENDGSILAKGTHGSGQTLTTTGAGTRMIWHPKKSAFRAGTAISSEWDEINIGEYSVAFGKGTKASGTASLAAGTKTIASGFAATAFGYKTTASGRASFAAGDSTIASGRASLALGHKSMAIGKASMAFGDSTMATGNASFATGYKSLASGSASMALGNQTVASGTASMAMGNKSIAAGVAAMAMGDSTQALGRASMSMGHKTIASGMYSMAMCESTIAASKNSFTAGLYNHFTTGSPDSWVPTEPLFELGNGTSESNRSSCLVIFKNGKIGLNTITPSSHLQIKGSIGASVRCNSYYDVSFSTPYADTLDNLDQIVYINQSMAGSDGIFGCVLPNVTTCEGRVYTIKNTIGGAVPVRTTNNQLIDGVQPYYFPSSNSSLMVISDGTQWMIIGKY